ncbi:Hypothetical protein EPM1_0709 [Stenotrophomonas maltophilia EPM1]|nr:Hypothetical protein EPM1_0709 [Stenotrophomonas maltophilia EPM1]
MVDGASAPARVGIRQPRVIRMMTVAVAPDTYRAGTAVPLSLHDRRGREGGPGRVSGLSLAPGSGVRAHS